MKKPFLLLGLLLVITLFAGCSREYEEIDTYRYKQILASLFMDLNEVDKSMDQSTELDFNVLSNTTKAVRTMRITDAQILSNNDIEDSSFARQLAFAWGEGDLKYHVDLPGDEDKFVMETFSATTMTAYNLSYLVNLPTKLIANIRTNLSLSSYEDGLQLANVILTGSIIWFTALDVLNAVIGGVLAVIMLPIGALFGLLTSPIQTVLDIIPVLFGLVKTCFYAVTNLFY